MKYVCVFVILIYTLQLYYFSIFCTAETAAEGTQKVMNFTFERISSCVVRGSQRRLYFMFCLNMEHLHPLILVVFISLVVYFPA